MTEQGDRTPTPTDDEMPTEIEFWLREVTLSESEQDAIDPIVFSELSSGQKELVETSYYGIGFVSGDHIIANPDH